MFDSVKIYINIYLKLSQYAGKQGGAFPPRQSKLLTTINRLIHQIIVFELLTIISTKIYLWQKRFRQQFRLGVAKAFSSAAAFAGRKTRSRRLPQ
jgi:hypothetical protein